MDELTKAILITLASEPEGEVACPHRVVSRNGDDPNALFRCVNCDSVMMDNEMHELFLDWHAKAVELKFNQ